MNTEKEQVKKALHELFAKNTQVSTGDVVEFLGSTVSRQYVHRIMKGMAERGILQQVGSGRSSSYKAISLDQHELKTFQKKVTPNLEEDAVFIELLSERPELEDISKKSFDILRFVFTEMVNNVIDHADASQLEIRHAIQEDMVHIEVEDNGIGLFTRVMEQLKLTDTRHALERVLQGKTTTDAARHSGEGIFFSSKAAQFFSIEANGLLLEIDNNKNDHSVKESQRKSGTLIIFTIPLKNSISLSDVFREYTDQDTYAFEKTKITVKLYAIDTSFVSRSEARRLLASLDEKFNHIILDYKGVSGVGQAFADEIYRVFHSNHPDIIIESINTNKEIDFMLNRINKF